MALVTVGFFLVEVGRVQALANIGARAVAAHLGGSCSSWQVENPALFYGPLVLVVLTA